MTREFSRKAAALGYPALRFHDLRVSHETLLLDAGVPVHVVAARAGHDPAVLLRVYAKRTRTAETSAAPLIGNLFRRAPKPDVAGSGDSGGLKQLPRVAKFRPLAGKIVTGARSVLVGMEVQSKLAVIDFFAPMR